MAAFFRNASSRKAREKPLPPKKKATPRTGDPSKTTQYFESSGLVETALFLAFITLVVMICFLGQKPQGPRVILDHPAATRIVAEYPFSYTSEIAMREKISEVRAQVPPVFERTFEPFRQFRETVTDLNSAIAKAQIKQEKRDTGADGGALRETIREAIAKNGATGIDPEAVLALIEQTTPRQRSELFSDALEILRELYEEGIFGNQTTQASGGRVAVIQLADEEGRDQLPEARSLDESLVALRVRINALSGDADTARALFNVFKEGVQPNLVYSAAATRAATQRAIDRIEPVVFEFDEGDTLINPGSVVRPVDIERIEAYREAGEARGRKALLLDPLFLERCLLTLLLLVAIYIYVKQGLREIHKRNHSLAIAAVSILLNLLVIRLIMEVGEVALTNSRGALSMLPFFAPFALAPVLVSVLVGAAPAAVSALIIGVLFGIMQNNSIEFALIAFLSGVVGSFTSANIRKRSKAVRAGLLSGASAAIAGAAIGLFGNLSPTLVGQQTLAALSVGLLTGVVAVGLLPVFEQLFKITTEITLLELTDFNHPLLRRMQVEAPGTYHHSLMVANLSENAAAAIGARPLLCRVCSFFHDIGKLVKPDYFVENQQGGTNPHAEKNPSMSALVIKAHVKEGVELARKHGLPRVIIEVIRQHHGTSLIQFFYHRARQLQKNGGEAAPAQPAKSGDEPRKADQAGRGRQRPPQPPVKVEESTYRYDGPKPAFKESAIIFFADGLEAASRTLPKVTQPAIDEMIDNMFRDRIEDGQLDQCPLTFKELHEIRRSFSRTLLNMLHARVEYPKEEKETEDRRPATEEQPPGRDEADEPQTSGPQTPPGDHGDSNERNQPV